MAATDISSLSASLNHKTRSACSWIDVAVGKFKQGLRLRRDGRVTGPAKNGAAVQDSVANSVLHVELPWENHLMLGGGRQGVVPRRCEAL